MITIDLNGKNVLITGGGGGIAAGIARQYALAGADVYITDISEEKLSSTASALQKDGLSIKTRQMDVTDEENVCSVIDQIVKDDGKLDILVNGAGIMYQKPYMETTTQELLRTLNINLVGMDICCRAALKDMIQKRSGKIINICSAASRLGVANLAHYSESKFGAMGLTQAVALAVAEYGINVNGLCPGFVKTELFDIFYRDEAEKNHKKIEDYIEVTAQNIPLHRLQTPEDVGNAAVFLSSDMAVNITGQLLNVCGGMRLN